MAPDASGNHRRPVVAFGPRLPQWGSWEWVGEDIARKLSDHCQVITFQGYSVPPCDLAVIVKHPLPAAVAKELGRRSRVIYAPVDNYGHAAAIAEDAEMLRACHRILVHCERLRRHFEPFAPVELVDHHVKFVAPMRPVQRPRGHILWVGVRSNLLPLVEWVNVNPLPFELELHILTNLEDASRVLSPQALGFNGCTSVRIEEWTRQRHIELLCMCRGVIDIKGDDFRQRHKPPAKAIDCVASGVPIAMNQDSSPVEHLARMGFEVAAPLDPERWFSQDYWRETVAFGTAVREILSIERVAMRYRRIIDEVMREEVGSAARGSEHLLVNVERHG